jgi:hypothetical protein
LRRRTLYFSTVDFAALIPSFRSSLRSQSTDLHSGAQRPGEKCRLARIDAVSRSPPTLCSHQPIPRRWRCDDLPDSLCVKCQPSQRHMSVVVAPDHLLHGFDFFRSRARGYDSRTAGSIIQLAPGFSTTPRSASQPPHRVEPFVVVVRGFRQRGRHDGSQRDRT